MAKKQTAPNPKHEQQPADETIAAGEHMDVEEMDRAVDAERRAGAPMPTGYNPTVSQGQPNLSEEMQGMELIAKTVGPPQYGSPDPASSASRLMTLEDGHPLAGLESGTAAISEDYGADVVAPSARMHQLQDNPQSGAEIDATPKAVEFAAENDVDLAEVQGSGQDGRITKDDVENYVSARDEGTTTPDDDQTND